MVIVQGVYLDRQRLLGENGRVVADNARLKNELDDALRPTASSKPPIDRETSEERRIKDVQRTVQAAIAKAANFPNATANAAASPTVLQNSFVNKGPRSVYETLLQFDQTDLKKIQHGTRLAAFVGDYYQFEQDALALENDLVNRIGTMVAVRFRQGWLIYLRYAVLRFMGLTREEVMAAGDFLNYSITWDDAERVFAHLHQDSSVITTFGTLSKRYRQLADFVDTLKS